MPRPPRSPAALVLACLALAAASAMGARAPATAGPGGGHPADAPDIPVAIDAQPNGDLFLAMQPDVVDQGGLARMSPDCVGVASWLSGPVLDLAVDRANGAALWVLEAAPADPQGNRQVVHYSSSGARLGAWPAPASARFVQSERSWSSTDLYLAHEATEHAPARVTVHAEDGTLRRTWNLAGEVRGLAATNNGGPERPIWVVTADGPGRAGRLWRYDVNGAVVWEKPLDVVPTALADFGGLVAVAGALPGAAGPAGRIYQYNEEGLLLRDWPLVDFVPKDLAGSASANLWVLGHPPAAPGQSALRRYTYDGTLLSGCDRFPQPSVPTPAGTAACPVTTPGAVAWRFEAAGVAPGVAAVARDGTSYLATQKGLLYAVDCAGRRKWLFDYREEQPGWGPQAFEGSPALDEDGTLYIGDDVVVPNYFFAIRPDGTVKWVQRYESTYSQIDTSPALARDGHLFAAAHGWGAGVDHGTILVLHRDGRLIRPAGGSWGEDGVGPITDSPVVLADGSAAYLAPPFDTWVLPTGTPATATSVPPRPTRTPTGSTTLIPTPSPSPTAHVSGTPPSPTPTRDASPTPTPYRAWLPRALAQATWVSAAGGGRPAAPAQPMPPPWVTQPVPARLWLVRAEGGADRVVDLPGFADPSSPATDGQDVWFTAVANDGAHLLAYRATGAPYPLLDWPLEAGTGAAPLLGRRDPATGLLEVLLLGQDGRLVALEASAERGIVRPRWSRFIGLPAPGAPALGDDGRVYVAAGGVVQALDRATGERAWTVTLEAPVSGSVALAPGGLLLVPTAGGLFQAIGTGAGGLDPAALWPAFRRDARNGGSAEAEP